VPRPTQVPRRAIRVFAYRAVTLYGWPFQAIPLTLLCRYARSYNPDDPKTVGLGSSRFARHY
jgi:hypothetical protein